MNEETLVDYIEDRLSREERIRVEHHLFERDSSLEALILLEGASKEDNLTELQTVPDYLTENVWQTVYALGDNTIFNGVSGIIRWFGSLGRAMLRIFYPWKRMRFSAVRGSKSVIDANLIALKASFSEFDLQVEIDKIRPENVNLNIIMLPETGEIKAARATLIKNTREMSSYLFKGNRAFFEDVPFGRYTLVISANGAEKGKYSFEIKESRHGREQKP
jgi:hypothetical protein